ncbi:hypothetical protein [Paludisphaera rhizosphaerae]|uniref:hypothetical protein n=1 Tax=Paludisphaera rhizosphaerae TaxID=2711216 RepID=UPI0013EB0FBD|nr:hypothetical protein [Paludisphaera rhizosphaerae]
MDLLHDEVDFLVDMIELVPRRFVMDGFFVLVVGRWSRQNPLIHRQMEGLEALFADEALVDFLFRDSTFRAAGGAVHGNHGEIPPILDSRAFLLSCFGEFAHDPPDIHTGDRSDCVDLG